MPRSFRMALLPFSTVDSETKYAIVGLDMDPSELARVREEVAARWFLWTKELEFYPVLESPFHLWRTSFLVHSHLNIRLDVGFQAGRFTMLGAQGREVGMDIHTDHYGHFVSLDNDATAFGRETVAYDSIFD